MSTKERLDSLLVIRGLVPDLDLAQRLVMAGKIRVAGQVVYKPATNVPKTSEIQVIEGPRFVSRGGEKLEAALNSFAVQIKGRICADVGASTGGFTDCLLQHGASKVFAIDVGHGILDWKLRTDPRVVVMENTNARQLSNLPQPVSLITIDASFISLKVLLPVVQTWFSVHESGSAPDYTPEIIALIKPQYEANHVQASRTRGVIRDPQIHRQVLLDILNFGQNLEWRVMKLMVSPLLGPKGNREFLVLLSQSDDPQANLENLVDSVLE